MIHINDLIKLSEDMKEKGICTKCIDKNTTWKHSCNIQKCDWKDCDELATQELIDSHEWGVDTYYCIPHIVEKTRLDE